MTDEQKAETSFNGSWRQVRIFTSDFSDQWYLRILNDVVMPFSEAFPTTPFWFTRYIGDVTLGNDDQADTNFLTLPSNFLNGGSHYSLRLRFDPSSGEESFIRSKIKAPLWFSSFLDHNELHEFGGPRFCASPRPIDQSYRAHLVAKILHAHSLFILDCVKETNGILGFEDLQHPDRTDHNSSFAGLHHLICNPSGTSAGGSFITLRRSATNPDLWNYL